jgi:DeoR family transcriptional regulator, suf operon transcriptional repressor
MRDGSGEHGSVGHVLGETRWRLLGELCRSDQSAAELAAAVQTSANAVRVHLEALQHAGLVTFRVERGRVGKPTHMYALTAAGESLVSKAYAPALGAILGAARGQLNGGFLRMLRTAGVALGRSVSRDPAEDGAGTAQRLLASLGAPAELDRTNGGVLLRVNCCPLAAVTRDTPEVCGMMAAALEAASGLKTREQCARGDHPRCGFELSRGTEIRE